MEAVSRHYRFIRLGLAAIILPAVLLSALGCYATRRSGDVTMMAGPGLKTPPGSDQETRDYFNKKIHFRNILHGHANARFKSGGGPVNVKIEPEVSVHNRSWYEALTMRTGDGAIVARIENVDRKDVAELGLTQNDRFAYMWVGPLTTDRGRRGVAFYTFDTAGNVKNKGGLTIDSVTICKDFSGHRPAAKINPDHGSAECELVTGLGAPAVASRAAGQLASYTRKLERGLAAGGLWVSCSGGCCDIGDGAFY